MKSVMLMLKVDYDENVTDPDSLASGFDQLLETVTGTPGILDDFGNPKIGEFIPESEDYIADGDLVEGTKADEVAAAASRLRIVDRSDEFTKVFTVCNQRNQPWLHFYLDYWANHLRLYVCAETQRDPSRPILDQTFSRNVKLDAACGIYDKNEKLIPTIDEDIAAKTSGPLPKHGT